MLLNSRPIRYVATRVARAYGFMDPIGLLARMRGFAQPSEVAEPIELLRAGMLFHARGLINTKAIQHNLDWVWPYWVERQFNPRDPSFIPRAFSFSHINLTHRNWTAVGLPGVPYYPIVDPRGLVTPLFDGWSIDVWFLPADGGEPLLPSKLDAFEQEFLCGDDLRVRSVARRNGVALTTIVRAELVDSRPECVIDVSVAADAPGEIAVALRPYNPEGVSIVAEVAANQAAPGWLVNTRHPVRFDRAPGRQLFSTYQHGDVLHRRKEAADTSGASCPVNMATALALFDAAKSREVQVRVPLFDELDTDRRPVFASVPKWPDATADLSRLAVTDSRIQRLFDQARTGLVLHSPGEVYPGPYTYKRFWFRDAVFILNAMVTLGGTARTEAALAGFGGRQRRDGYFLSQEGEWDSNGEVLWFLRRYAALTRRNPPGDWTDMVRRGARWIARKRLPRDSNRREAGLLPAGFSAEHLGPNDYYYWDDFWSVAGLRAAAEMLGLRDPEGPRFADEAESLLAAVEASLPRGPQRRFPDALPASPHRRMDSGAVGSLVADYPLQLYPAGYAGITATADFLSRHCLHEGGFFQDMIHSGINAYLTLHLAQVRLRAGETEAAWRLMDRVAELASPTGQWPEAIHPRTDGGCMGDGQHIWAAAEWLMMVRNCFVREEGDELVLGAGVRSSWIGTEGAYFGPTLTPAGTVSVRLVRRSGGIEATLDGRWHEQPPRLRWCLPGCRGVAIAAPAEGPFQLFLPFLS